MAKIRIQIRSVEKRPAKMVEWDDAGGHQVRGVGLGSSIFGIPYDELSAMGDGLFEIEPRVEPEVIPTPLPITDKDDPNYKPPRIRDTLAAFHAPQVIGAICGVAKMSTAECVFALASIESLLE